MSWYPNVSFAPKPDYSNQRNVQVDDMLRNFPGCKTSDRVQFIMPVQTPHGKVAELKIFLPRDFPKDAPHVSVQGSLDNPLLGKNGQFTRLQSLANWKYPQSALIHVVKEAYETLVGRSSVRPESNNQVIPSDFPQLKGLSTQELTNLLIDPEAFQCLAVNIVQEYQVDKKLKDMKQQVLQQAMKNLEKEDELKELCNAIAVVRSSEYLPAKEQFDGRAARQRAIMSTFDPEILKTRLASAAQRLDEESDTLLARFLEQEIPLDTFMEEYQERRREFHMKDIKCKTALKTIT